MWGRSNPRISGIFSSKEQQFKFFPISESIGNRYIIAAWDEERLDLVKGMIGFLNKNLND